MCSLTNNMYGKTYGIICDIKVASVAFFCLDNNRRYNRSLLVKFYSKELSEILLQSESYDTYIKLKEFVTSIRKKTVIYMIVFVQLLLSASCLKTDE